jgi:hypothetical protein
MSVMKEDGTRRLIQQILASLKIGKYAIMDTVLSNTSNNPVQNKVIKQAIDNVQSGITQINENAVFGTIVTLEETVSVDAHSTEEVTFDSVSLQGYSGYAVLNFGQARGTTGGLNYGNYVLVGTGYGVSDDYVLPTLRETVSTNDVTFKMRVINKASTTMTTRARMQVLLYK